MYVGTDALLFDNDGSTSTLYCDSGDTISYSASRSGSAIGTLTAGQAASITYPVWVRSASSSQAHVESASQATALGRGNRFAVLGDSVAAGVGTGTSADNTTGEFGLGWFEHACVSSNGRMRRIYNGGVPGDTTAQMVARLGSIRAAGVDWCFIQASINDVAAGGYSQAATLANIDTMVKALRGWNVEPILTTVQPNNTGPGTYFSNTLKLNAALTAYATLNGVHIIDFYGLLADVTTSGQYTSGLGEAASPAVHPSKAGHKLMGAAVAAWATSYVRYTPNYLALADADPNNLLPTGTFGGGTTGTAGVPTGWGVGGGSTTATVTYDSTDTTITGRWLQIDRASNDGTKFVTKTISTGWSVGDKLAFSGLAKLTLEAAVASVNVLVQFNGATSGPGFIYPMHGSPYELTSKGRFYGEGAVPPGTTGVVVSLQLNNGTVGAAAQAKFAQLTLVNRSVLGLTA